jgi:hypothetical protein
MRRHDDTVAMAAFSFHSSRFFLVIYPEPADTTERTI